MNIKDIITESQHACPHCGGPLVEYSGLMEKKDACYYKVKASAKVWPSAYASGRLVQCRKKGASNYGNKSEGVAEGAQQGEYGRVLTALGLYYPDKFSMEELNTPGWHRVIANKAEVPIEYAGQVINDFTRSNEDDEDDEPGVMEAQLDEKCWDGYQQQGMKNKGGRQVPNCVPTESVAEGVEGPDPGILFYAKDPAAQQKIYARVKDAEHLALLQQRYRGSEIKTFDFRRPDVLAWLEARGINLRKFTLGMIQTMYDGSRGHNESRGLNEFAPGAGGDDEAGDDPYKYPKPKRYNRSADYFGQFEADHFDREDFDDDTGVFKGYWGRTPIAYFKFANPARTGGDDPGMGWYYEPESNSSSNNTTAAPAADNADERKQQELSMIRQFLKSGNRPNPDSQIGRLMKKHGMAEDLSRRGFLRGLGAVAAGAVGVGAAGSAQARSTDASRKEDDEALALLAKGMTPEQVAKKLGVTGPNHGQTHQMGGGWATINRAAAQLRRQRQGINEFAPSSSDDDGNDGFSDDTLRQLAAQWYNGDEDPRVESTLAAAGWEIGQDEGYDDTPGVFVVQAGDINGNSYISWPAHELEGLTEATDPEIEEMYEAMQQLAEEMAASKGVSVDLVWESFEALDDHMLYETAAWRRKEGKSKKGGLNAKGVASYRRENPGSKLQMAVTTKPSKLKKGSKAAKRRKSFCARMGGVKGPMKKPNGKPTRKALALRKWNC